MNRACGTSRTDDKETEFGISARSTNQRTIMPGVTSSVRDGVCVIEMSNPPVNALALPVLEGLEKALKEAQGDGRVKAIVIKGAGGKFSGGFDIGHLRKSTQGAPASDVGDFNAILCTLAEGGAKPCVAAIENLALGGGLEVAMSCAARVATPGAQLGLPELQLGVIPGFGGTQRLPRLVGLEKSLEMMLKSKSIKAEEALKLGLVDKIVDQANAVHAACELAKSIASGSTKRELSMYRKDKLPDPKTAQAILKEAGKKAKHVQSVMPHVALCVDAIAVGITEGPEAGLQREAVNFKKAVSSPAAKGLVHFFFAQRATNIVPGVTDGGLKPRVMKSVGVVGGGLMGSGIATACLLAGIGVVLKEIKQEFLDAGVGRIQSNLASMVRKGRMTEDKAQKLMSLVKPTLSDDDFRQCDMVIEAVIENLDLKQKIFCNLEKICRPDCILSTNTSTIDITKIAAKMKNPERIVGAHFFSPAHVMQLFEIIRTKDTPPQILVDTLGLSKQIRKTPVVVGNCTGFAVNRVFFPYTMSATALVDIGCDPYAIDRAIMMFGMPMGPFRLGDLVGHDVGVHVGKNFIDDFPDRVYQSPLIPSLLTSKRLGEKSGAGFYKYDNKRRATPDPEGVEGLIAASRAQTRLPLDGSSIPNGLTPQEIAEMIFFPVVNEACRVLDEGIVVKAGDIDTASILGMGFPAFRGGIVHWGDSVGAAVIATKLRTWATRYGGLYQPCPYLENCAIQGRTLAQGPLDTKLKSRL